MSQDGPQCADVEISDPKDLELLRTIADASPFHPPGDARLVQDFRINANSEIFNEDFIVQTILIAQKCGLLHLTLYFRSNPDQQPYMESSTFQALLDGLPQLTKLQSLSITMASLRSEQAIEIIQALPPSIIDLDLHKNLIGNYGGQNFSGFCQEIVDSKLKSLQFGTSDFNDDEAEILAQYLAKIKRPFKFTLYVNPNITEKGFQSFMRAMDLNQNLAIILSDVLHFSKIYDKKTTPNLFQLALYQYLTSEHHHKNLICENVLNVTPEMKTWLQNFAMHSAQNALLSKIEDPTHLASCSKNKP